MPLKWSTAAWAKKGSERRRRQPAGVDDRTSGARSGVAHHGGQLGAGPAAPRAQREAALGRGRLIVRPSTASLCVDFRPRCEGGPVERGRLRGRPTLGRGHREHLRGRAPCFSQCHVHPFESHVELERLRAAITGYLMRIIGDARLCPMASPRDHDARAGRGSRTSIEEGMREGLGARLYLHGAPCAHRGAARAEKVVRGSGRRRYRSRWFGNFYRRRRERAAASCPGCATRRRPLDELCGSPTDHLVPCWPQVLQASIDHECVVDHERRLPLFTSAGVDRPQAHGLAVETGRLPDA